MATSGEKEIKTSWDELTASDSTKYIGHKQQLEAETDLTEHWGSI